MNWIWPWKVASVLAEANDIAETARRETIAVRSELVAAQKALQECRAERLRAETQIQVQQKKLEAADEKVRRLAFFVIGIHKNQNANENSNSVPADPGGVGASSAGRPKLVNNK